MIKKTVTYTDWDGNTQTRELHFNITATELGDHMYLQEELTNIQQYLQTHQEITGEGAQMLFAIVKKFVQLAYGQRVGDQFRKSEDVWDNFRWSAAYDPFVFGLIENPEECMAFLTGVMPADLLAEAEKQTNQAQLPFSQTAEAVETTKNVFEQNEQPKKPLEEMSEAELREELQKRM